MNQIARITTWGMALNILLTILKFIVGIIFKSQACVADAVHSLSDFLTDIAVLVGVRFWSAPADVDHPHGHQRIEALITLFIGLLLAFTAIRMGINAVIKIGETIGESNASENAIQSLPVFFVALLSIATKEILYQWSVIVGKACHSSAVIANAWHHRSDAISSIPVVIVAIAGRFWPQVTYLDPIGTILISCMLLHTAWIIAWPRLKELSDEGASQIELSEMQRIAASIPGVEEVHELRTRRLGDGLLLDMHILVDKNMTVEDGHRICEEAATAIQNKMPSVLDVLTHLEPVNSVDLNAEITRIALGIPGVKSVHGIRVRKVLTGYDVDLHVMVEPTLTVAEGHAICGKVKKAILTQDLKIVNLLTHIEPDDSLKSK